MSRALVGRLLTSEAPGKSLFNPILQAWKLRVRKSESFDRALIQSESFTSDVLPARPLMALHFSWN